MDDRVDTARRNFNQAAVEGENVAQDAQMRYTAALNGATDLSTKLVEMVRANTEAALEATAQIATARNPADLVQAWTAYGTKQFAMLNEQTRELMTVWHNVGARTAGPFARR